MLRLLLKKSLRLGALGTVLTVIGAPLAAACPAPFRVAQIDTMGVLVCGEDSVSDRALTHAARVILNLLDFDQDDQADNPKVVD